MFFEYPSYSILSSFYNTNTTKKFNSANVGILQFRCGRRHFPNWIKIAASFPRLPVGRQDKENNSQICRSVFPFGESH
jgi:hypothetical protein